MIARPGGELGHAVFQQTSAELMILRVPMRGPVTVEACNAAFRATTGLPGTPGVPIEVMLTNASGTIIAADARFSIGTAGIDCQHSLLYPSGERVVRHSYRELPTDDGIRRVLLTQLDLTERRRVEAALRQTTRLEAIGQLTGGVAHEFNNLLTAILGAMELLSTRLAEDRPRRLVDTAITAAKRGAALTQQLLSYARKQFLAPAATDIPSAVAEMAELIRGSLGSRITFATDFAPGTWPALADPAQLELALLNLVVNARDAMPEGGTLTMSSNNLHAGAAELPRDLQPGAYVLLSVSDTGTGMAPDVLARAMEPFFTTKGIGQGSGLGLAQVYGYAQQLGGTVRLHSVPSQGSTAEIFLPRATESRVAEAAPRLLLVDPDADARATNAAILRGDGWLVHEVAGGSDALDALGNTPFNAVVAEASLPGLSGIDLAVLARQADPGLPVIFLSAVPTVDAGRQFPGPVLARGCSPDELRNAIRNAFTGR